MRWYIDKVKEGIKKLATAREKEIGRALGWKISNSAFGDQAGYVKGSRRLMQMG